MTIIIPVYSTRNYVIGEYDTPVLMNEVEKYYATSRTTSEFIAGF